MKEEVENYRFLYEKIEDESFQKRVRYSFEYYIEHANSYKFWGMVLSILGIILPALATALTACNVDKACIAWITAAATVASGMLAYFKCSEKHETYRKAAENMKAELVAYAADQGAYKNDGTESFDKDKILFARIENIIQNGYDRIVEIDKKSGKSEN